MIKYYFSFSEGLTTVSLLTKVRIGMKLGQIIKQELCQHLAQRDFQRSIVKQSDFEVFNVKVDQIEESQDKGRAAHRQFQLEIAVICDNDFLARK